MIDESLVDTRMKQKEIGIDVLCHYSLGVDPFVILERSWNMLFTLGPNSPPRKERGSCIDEVD